MLVGEHGLKSWQTDTAKEKKEYRRLAYQNHALHPRMQRAVIFEFAGIIKCVIHFAPA